MKRSATAEWRGGLKGGHGSIETQSQALLGAAFSADSRFGTNPGTNPEELIAAALAGCFSMALAANLEKEGFVPDWIDTDATVTLKRAVQGWSIPEIQLQVSVSGPQFDGDLVERIAKRTKETCPVAKLLKADIGLSVRLMSQNDPALQETG